MDKGEDTMKLYKILKVVCVFLCTLMVVLSFAACEKKGEFAFNSNLDAQIEVKYEPKISVKNGSIVSVVLHDDNGEKIELGEDYSFTPNRFGKYHFTIVVNMDNQLKEFIKTITVGDFVAPEIVQVPTQPKTVEVGGYNGFEEDLSQIIVRDNDVASLSYLTKKAVKISGNGMVQENPNGLTEVLLSSVGEYVVKVEVKDVSGNVVYTEYKLDAVDTTAPVLSAFDVRYAWLVDGMVKIPELIAIDVSNVTVSVVASKDGNSLNIVNDKIIADVYDEIELLYTAKDAYENSAQKKFFLKYCRMGNCLMRTTKIYQNIFLRIKVSLKWMTVYYLQVNS